MEKLITKLIRILDGEEGPTWQGDHEEDARYTYPKRIALARTVATEIENLLTSRQSRQITRCEDCGTDSPEAKIRTLCGRCRM